MRRAFAVRAADRFPEGIVCTVQQVKRVLMYMQIATRQKKINYLQLGILSKGMVETRCDISMAPILSNTKATSPRSHAGVKEKEVE